MAAYFAVSESDRYGSSTAWRPRHWITNPAWPSHQARSPSCERSAVERDVGEQGLVALHRLDEGHAPTSSRTRRTPSTIAASFCRAAHRAVCDRPQSGAKDSRVGRREAKALPHPFGDVLRRLEVVALHVDDADGDVVPLGDGCRSRRARPSRGWPSRRGSRPPRSRGRPGTSARTGAGRRRGPCSCRSTDASTAGSVPTTGATVRLKMSTKRARVLPVRVAAHRRLVDRDLRGIRRRPAPAARRARSGPAPR